MMWLTMGRGTPHNQNRKCKKQAKSALKGVKNPTLAHATCHHNTQLTLPYPNAKLHTCTRTT